MKKKQEATLAGQKNRKTILPLLAYLLIASFFLSPKAMQSYGRPIEVVGGLSVGSILKAVHLVTSRIKATFLTLIVQNPWEQRYQEAIEQQRKMTEKISELERIALQNKDLKEALGLSRDILWNHVNAQIIARSGSTLQDSLTIDVGSVDGIYRDAPVIGYTSEQYGLIGKVHTVGKHQSTVVNLVSRVTKLGVTAMLAKAGFAGVLTRDGSKYRLDYINQQALSYIKSQDLVVSGGSSASLYPIGIPIGRVQKVEKLQYSASLSLIVEPIVYVSKAKYVAVLLRTESHSGASVPVLKEQPFVSPNPVVAPQQIQAAQDLQNATDQTAPSTQGAQTPSATASVLGQ